MNPPLLPRRHVAVFALAALAAGTLAIGTLAGWRAHESAAVTPREETWGLVNVGLAVTTLLAVGLAAGVALSTRRRLGEMTEAFDEAARRTRAAASQLVDAGRAVATGCTAQGSSVSETGAALEQISAMIRSTADNAAQAKDLAAQARAAAEAGSITMADMRGAMRAIETSSGEVAKIVSRIDEIAFQTNILALNAAVEAARAGEAGSGFAVVADEVRSLAQRSAAAARETAERIAAAIASSQQGSASCDRVGESLGEIAAKVTAADGLVAEIATAAREQAQGIREIGAAVARMDSATQETAAAAERTATAASGLATEAEAWGGHAETPRTVTTDAPRTVARKPTGDKPRSLAVRPVPRPLPPRTRGPLIPMPGDPATESDPEERHFRDF